jgi:hypothetical protein
MQAYDDTIRARLKRLLRDHNQAKLARATGRSRNALTRYVHGAKLPLSFGAALVDELGVNPAWLLSGDEPMYLADVPASAGELGGELLGLMRALDQVSGLKLGALAGHKHARALRELTETLDRYGSLRDRLNRISAPVLAELLTQAEAASSERKLDRAHALVKAAFRVQQFCDDRELAQRLVSVQAILKLIEQHSDEALRLQMSVFQSRIALDAEFSQIAETAAGLAQALRSNWYSARAQRVVRIALSFARPADRTSGPWSMLQGQRVMASVELGEYAGLAQDIEDALVHCPVDQRQLADAAKTFHHLNRGLWTAQELAGGRPTTFAAAAMVLNAAYCTDDPEVIEAALNRARAIMQAQMPLNRSIVARGERVLQALRGKLRVTPETPASRGPASDFTAAVYNTQLLRLSRDKRTFEHMQLAQRSLDSLPADQSPNPFQLALHLRNVLTGIDPTTRYAQHRALRERAESLRAERIAGGHGLLAQVG